MSAAWDRARAQNGNGREAVGKRGRRPRRRRRTWLDDHLGDLVRRNVHGAHDDLGPAYVRKRTHGRECARCVLARRRRRHEGGKNLRFHPRIAACRSSHVALDRRQRCEGGRRRRRVCAAVARCVKVLHLLCFGVREGGDGQTRGSHGDDACVLVVGRCFGAVGA